MGAEQQVKINKLRKMVEELNKEILDLKAQIRSKTEIAEIYGEQRDRLTKELNDLRGSNCRQT